MAKVPTSAPGIRPSERASVDETIVITPKTTQTATKTKARTTRPPQPPRRVATASPSMPRKAGRRRLVDLAEDWLLLILAIRRVAELRDAEALRNEALGVWSEFDSAARAAGFEAEDIELADYALVAFTNESAFKTRGDQRGIWMQNPLRNERLGRVDAAGVQFYEELKKLRVDPDRRIEALEVYTACLQLGFEGQLGDPGPRQELIQALARSIRAVRREPEAVLAPNAIRSEKVGPATTRRFTFYAIAGFFALTLLAMLMVNQIAGCDANRTAKAIEKHLPAGGAP